MPGTPEVHSRDKQGTPRTPVTAGVPISSAPLVEQWLLCADIADARRALANVKARRPDLFEGPGLEEKGVSDPQVCVLPPNGPRRRPGFMIRKSASSIDAEDVLDCIDLEAMVEDLPIVQFTAPVYFCHEDEETMVVEVARIGAQNVCSAVQYTTEDVTAFEGLRYRKSAGKLVFQPGETQKKIHVPLVYTEDWETTTEFLVRLVPDPPPIDCELGRYLHKARVKVIDGGVFPARRFRQEIEDGMINTIPKWPLLYDYVCLNFRSSGAGKGTIKMVMLDALHNLYFLLQLLMNVYLVDRVIGGDSDEEPIFILLAIAALLIVPFGALHVLDVLRLTWKVNGPSCTLLQKALLRKFLNYTESSRRQLNRADIMMAMTGDVASLVHEGYGNAIALIKSVSEIFAVLLFQILAPVLFKQKVNRFPFLTACIFPVFLIGFLLVRRKVTTHQLVERSRKQDAMLAQLDCTVTNYRLIADFNTRPLFVSQFESCIEAYNEAEVNAKKVLKNNTYFALWLTSIAVAFYTVVGALQVYHDDGLGIGMFLANVATIRAIGSSMGSIYSILVEMQGTFPALENITTLLNLPIDLTQRLEINRYRRGKTMIEGDEGVDSSVDRLPIIATNVMFDFSAHCSVKNSSSAALGCSGRMEVQQGQLVSLIGPKAEGKSTLLRILGGAILSKPGSLFVPSHLRVLHISSEPLFFKGSLFDNLTFGVLCDEDGDPDRVMKICWRLGLQKTVLALVQEGKDGEPQAWNEVLSFTQRCLLCIARAFIANPELMCIHKPTMPFDEQASLVIFHMLHEFCEKRGVEMDEKRWHRRRPRTCIITSSKAFGVKMSDAVYSCSQKDGLKRVDVDNLQEHMLS